nr:MAG TPA: hypothetical protein [Caudoviricetes sp.]
MWKPRSNPWKVPSPPAPACSVLWAPRARWRPCPPTATSLATCMWSKRLAPTPARSVSPAT